MKTCVKCYRPFVYGGALNLLGETLCDDCLTEAIHISVLAYPATRNYPQGGFYGWYGFLGDEGTTKVFQTKKEAYDYLLKFVEKAYGEGVEIVEGD